MFWDARAVDDGSELSFDVCIVGAGAAGITIARELVGSGLRVAVLESGGFELDQATQELYRGDNVGHSYWALSQSRVRYFGGTTNAWAGYCRPLEPIDFTRRPGVPYSGWPFPRQALVPYYRRAHVVCELGPFDYRVPRWDGATGSPRLRLGRGAPVRTVVYQFSPPTNFGTRYRADLRRARNVTVLLHANVVGIELGPNGKLASRLRVATLTGKRFTVRAGRYVLAAGGIENARLLLASNDVYRAGVGNAHDLVGRFFAEHPHGHAALLAVARAASLAFYDRRETADSTTLLGGLATTPAFMRGRGLLGAAGTFAEPDVYTAAAVPREMLAVAGDLEGVSGWRLVSLYVRAEQAPNPDSRVTLGRVRDALGMPEARLDWRFTELDRRSMAGTVDALAQALGRSGVGRVYTRLTDADAFWDGVVGGRHHMGTTRMHRDPRQGVVDADCRVHGVRNLHLAGSSVFPTSGYANPTLTIVALAIRLADHLKARAR